MVSNHKLISCMELISHKKYQNYYFSPFKKPVCVRLVADENLDCPSSSDLHEGEFQKKVDANITPSRFSYLL